MATKKSNNVGTVAAISAGVAAVAAAGYFLFGPDGKKNRKNIKGWSLRMKGEVLEKIEQAKELTEPMYNTIVDKVASKYLSDDNKREVEALVSDLKKHWNNISKAAQKTAKKATKKTSSKSARAKKGAKSSKS
ncbi:MAG TPA: hypothetical protein VFQ59_03495 [Candidatus Paceibacterota bacterium]|nr:hypothetical protein [Candidatus Paceibacterota bacterium]